MQIKYFRLALKAVNQIELVMPFCDSNHEITKCNTNSKNKGQKT